MKSFVMKFLRDEEGLTIVEYAVAGTMITIAVLAAFTALGGQVTASLTRLRLAMVGT